MVIAILSILSAILYRLGGGWSTINHNKLFRRIGCSICVVIASILTLKLKADISTILAIILLFGANYVALSTYWKGKEVDCKWYHWLFTGIGYGLAALPLLIGGNAGIPGIMLRTAALGITTMYVSEKSDNVWIEEFWRGALIILTIPLLLIKL